MADIDTIITNRLGEHQRKVDFITSNMANQKVKRFSPGKIVYLTVSIAACLAIIFSISPLLFKSNPLSDITVSAPDFSEYRGGGEYEEIDLNIKKGNYAKALLLVDAELNKNAIEIESIMSADMSAEEKEYTLALYNNSNEELLWSKIYLMIKLEKKRDLELCCYKYLNNSSFILHRDEVGDILRVIR